MNYILFDNNSWNNLLPLTFTRPVAEIRTGILTIREKWEKLLKVKVSYLTQEYLQEKYPTKIEDENILISGDLIPNKTIIKEIENLKLNEALVVDDKLLAVQVSKADVSLFKYDVLDNYHDNYLKHHI